MYKAALLLYLIFMSKNTEVKITISLAELNEMNNVIDRLITAIEEPKHYQTTIERAEQLQKILNLKAKTSLA